MKKGAVNSEIVIDLKGKDQITAVITNESVENLGLKKGSKAYGLIKASWVVLADDPKLKTSARNRFTGKIEKLTEGTVNTEVVMKLPGGNQLVSMITNESAKSMGLKKGKNLLAMFKASSVIVGV